MTRINGGICPTKLTDQHLLAEYNEMGMVYNSLDRTLKSKNGLDRSKIPRKYTLNQGHVYFHYDKLLYLKKRYESLKNELKQRGFNLDPQRQIGYKIYPSNLYNDWSPTEEDLSTIKERLILRIKQKPAFYRYYRTPIDNNFIKEMYE
jgi:deoxyribonuclease (pyrimidine dimer)